MHRIPVRDIMKSPVITIDPNALAVDAAQLMEEHTVRRLPVVDDEGCLVGIVTDADTLEAETAEDVLNVYEPGAEEEWLAVADIMTREVVTIAPDATIGQLAGLFAKHKIGGAPVVEIDPNSCAQRKVVGIVSETDIFTLIAQAWEAEQVAITGET